MIPELLPGERVLWTGRPAGRRLLTWRSGLAFAAALAIAGGAVALGSELAVVGPMLAAAAAGLLWRRYRLGATTSTLTDERLVEITEAFGRFERSAFLTVLPGPVLVPGRNGTGAVTFGETDPVSVFLGGFGVWRWRTGMGTVTVPAMLVGIAEPEEVRDLIDQAMDAARERERGEFH